MNNAIMSQCNQEKKTVDVREINIHAFKEQFGYFDVGLYEVLVGVIPAVDGRQC